MLKLSILHDRGGSVLGLFSVFINRQRAFTEFILAGALFSLAAQTTASPAWAEGEWPYYGHDAGGMRYSPVGQINRQNVARLKVAWTYHTGDVADGAKGRNRSGFETTPIFVDGKLFLTTPFNRVIALDGETGR